MPADELPHQLARTRRFSLGTPSRFTVSPDGDTVFFLRSRAGQDPVSCLWALDVPTGKERLLADPRRLTDPQQEPSGGIVDYAADDACTVLAFTLGGRLWTVRTADGELRRLPVVEPVADPRPDPTGERIAYAGGGALRVVEADGSRDRTLAAPDGPEVCFGRAEQVAAESMGRHRGYWWAPDGRRLLVARVDSTPVQRWYLSDPSDPARPPSAIRYPAAGTANADVSLWIAPVDGPPGSLIRVAWDTAAFEYLTAAGWDGHGPFAAVQSRDQRHVQVCGIEPGTGAITVLAEQRDDAWVQLVPGLPARTGSGALVSTADRENTRRLLVAGRPVTPPGLQVGAVLAVDGHRVLFTASGDDPAETHLWSHDPQRGLRRLSGEPGVHGGTCRGGTTVVTTRSANRHGVRTTVHVDRGEPQPRTRTAEIVSHAELPVLEPRPELLRLGPRAVRAALFLPSWHRPDDGPLPVLVDSYGGPALRKVNAARTWSTYVSQWFAEQGFAVLAVDGRGTPGRGPAWERAIHLDIAGPVLEDQVQGLTEAAALRPQLDLTRVAVRGWSFGGFLAALAVLRRPDVFHAAIAGAPVTDQRLYDTHWRERHLGHPDRHPQAYDRCSPVLEAATLSRPLLLVHGLADDNVIPAHTLRFSAALLAAGRPHEVLPLPRTAHTPSDPTVAANLLTHERDFLRRALRLPG